MVVHLVCQRLVSGEEPEMLLGDGRLHEQRLRKVDRPFDFRPSLKPIGAMIGSEKLHEDEPTEMVMQLCKKL